MYTLTIEKTGPSNGTITSNPAGINFGSTCSFTFPYGTMITLNRNDSYLEMFTGWGEACSGSGTCQVVMNSDKTITAANALGHVIHLSISYETVESPIYRQANGEILYMAASPCSSTWACVYPVYESQNVFFTARPGYGSKFGSWGGICEGLDSCSVTIDSSDPIDMYLTASFLLND